MLLWASVLALLALLSAGGGLAVAAPPSHVFDPTLSVTGGCTTNEDDPVADPGCPYQAPPAGPSESFSRTAGMTVDSFGDVYVLSPGPENENKAYLQIFDPEGFYITELHLENPNSSGQGLNPRSVAVDSKGYLYVYSNTSGANLLRYDRDPAGYDPANGKIAYKPEPHVVANNASDYASLAVNPMNDHLFVNFGVGHGPGDWAIQEFGSGEDGNPLVSGQVAEVCCFDGPGLAIDASDATHGRLYATDEASETSPRVIRVFELGAPHALIKTIDGSSTPRGFPNGPVGAISLAVDESTGNIFVYEQEKAEKVIYELTEDGQYLSSIEHDFQTKEKKSQVVVDNGAHSPNGALNNPNGHYIWATSAPLGVGHAYAFKPTNVTAPEVEAVSFSEVSENEALLEATIDSGQADTAYTIEYVSEQQFEESGFAGAQLAAQDTVTAAALPDAVSAEATGLLPGTVYRIRVFAENEVGKDEAFGELKTYPSIAFGPCANDALRVGPSAALPDCRAYELVTPADTAGRPPMGLGLSGVFFPTLPASPDGNRLSFRIENGLIPGIDATGSLQGDPYLATRDSGGWSTIATGADGTEAETVLPGGRSADQTYSAWQAAVSGPALIGGQPTVYVRYPDGHSAPFGRGSLGVDPSAEPKLISEGGAHMLFTSSVRLEENAPATGQLAVYDRTADEVTHVVSLLPGNIIPYEAQVVRYTGSSSDGRGVAFTITQAGVTSLYLRYENQTTYKIGTELTFEGVAEGGGRVFYLKEGNLLAFDTASGKTISFASGGDVTVVNVSADGSTAYFASPDKLTSAPNPLGKKAVVGKENLYRSHEGSIAFLGTLSERDVVGEGANVRQNGLGLWVKAVGAIGTSPPGSFAIDPSRTTADGGVLLFQSDADLTAQGSEGVREVYRYDTAANELACVSCNPTGAPARGDALLQNVTEDIANPEPNTAFDLVGNLSSSGRRAFFQSPDPLVARDTDRLTDVYEWEAQGVGSCADSGGCLYLISSGHSGKLNYLYAASGNGEDVFFRTSDLLTATDKEAIPSIYDARVGGGFPAPLEAAGCEGEGCRSELTPPPALPTPGSSVGKSGNVSPKCHKGSRRVKRHGEVRCIRRKKHHRHKRPTRAGREGASK
jgi:hypothetical protein